LERLPVQHDVGEVAPAVSLGWLAGFIASGMALGSARITLRYFDAV
jgi:hypothetical protein